MRFKQSIMNFRGILIVEDQNNVNSCHFKGLKFILIQLALLMNTFWECAADRRGNGELFAKGAYQLKVEMTEAGNMDYVFIAVDRTTGFLNYSGSTQGTKFLHYQTDLMKNFAEYCRDTFNKDMFYTLNLVIISDTRLQQMKQSQVEQEHRNSFETDISNNRGQYLIPSEGSYGEDQDVGDVTKKKETCVVILSDHEGGMNGDETYLESSSSTILQSSHNNHIIRPVPKDLTAVFSAEEKTGKESLSKLEVWNRSEEEIVSRIQSSSSNPSCIQKEIKCRVCWKTFRNRFAVASHMKCHTEKSRTMINFSSEITEKTRKEQSKLTSKYNKVECCNRSTSDVSDAENHTLGSASVPNKNYPSESSLVGSLGENTNQCKCGICRQLFRNRFALSSHMKKHSKVERKQESMEKVNSAANNSRFNQHENITNERVSCSQMIGHMSQIKSHGTTNDTSYHRQVEIVKFCESEYSSMDIETVIPENMQRKNDFLSIDIETVIPENMQRKNDFLSMDIETVIPENMQRKNDFLSMDIETDFSKSSNDLMEAENNNLDNYCFQEDEKKDKHDEEKLTENNATGNNQMKEHRETATNTGLGFNLELDENRKQGNRRNEEKKKQCRTEDRSGMDTTVACCILCHICQKGFRNRFALSSHMKCHSDRKRMKRQCIRSSNVEKDGGCDIQHQNDAAHHIFEKMNNCESRTVACLVCGKRFRNRFGLSSHMKCHSDRKRLKGKYDENICHGIDMTKMNEKSVIKVDASYARGFICKTPNLGKANNGRKHADSNSSEIRKEKKYFSCKFPMENSIFDEISNKANNKVKTDSAAIVVPKGTVKRSNNCNQDGQFPIASCIKCPLCSETFKEESDFMLHIKLHGTANHEEARKVDGLSSQHINEGNKIVQNHQTFLSRRENFTPSSVVIPEQCKNGNRPAEEDFPKENEPKLHEQSGDEELSPLVCDICYKSFRTGYGLMRHIAIHSNHRPFLCHVCDQSFRTESELYKHTKRTKGRIFACKSCHRHFFSEEKLTLHKEVGCIKCDKNSTKMTNFFKICKETFSASVEYNRHVTSDIINNTFPCKNCGKVLCSRASLLRHLVVKHSSMTPFECTSCGKSFKLKENLKRHESFAHKGIHYTCGLCGKQCSQRGNLSVHMLTHTKSRPFVCEVCGQKFRKKDQLNTHLRYHTNERPFQCEKCKRTFRNKDTLRNHMRIHETPSIMCDICGKTFQQKAQFYQHKQEHKGFVYECEFCGKSLRRATAFKCHLADEHGLEAYKKLEDRAKANNGLGMQLLKCNLCDKVYGSKKRLRRHLTIHNGVVKLFECSVCKKRFAEKDYLNQHMKIHSCLVQIKCSICGEEFATKVGKDRHSSLHHCQLVPSYLNFQPLFEEQNGDNFGHTSQNLEENNISEDCMVQNSTPNTMVLEPVNFNRKDSSVTGAQFILDNKRQPDSQEASDIVHREGNLSDILQEPVQNEIVLQGELRNMVSNQGADEETISTLQLHSEQKMFAPRNFCTVSGQGSGLQTTDTSPFHIFKVKDDNSRQIHGERNIIDLSLLPLSFKDN